MKHTVKVTIVLLVLFLFAQLIGLLVISNYVEVKEVISYEERIENGIIVIDEVVTEEEVWETLPLELERPEIEGNQSYVAIIGSIIVATILALVLIKFEAAFLWKIWFFLSVLFTLGVAFNAFIIQGVAIILALLFAYLKAFRHNVYIHNFTELFIYGGLAAIFVPILSVVSMLVLLFLISLYDMYAVWKSKHMIKMAKFQTKLKLFAGLLVPYGKNKVAILGGGDIGFPLLFTGVIFKTYGWEALWIIFGSLLALSFLLFKSKKNKYYPAMPFISLGCLFGYLIVLI
jgi:presenilin-like A22 family membrane protease